MMSKRVCFHIDEDDFIGVGSHITLTDGNSVPVSGQYNQSPSNKVLWWVGSKVIEGLGTIQLNKYETAPNFIQLNQNFTLDCLLIYLNFPLFPSSCMM